MPAEFDFRRSIPNPWFVKVHGADYVRVIEKDLAALFPDNESMNVALRSVAEPMKNNPIDDDDPVDAEIDFSESRLNPYWLGVIDRSRVRVLDSDVAESFRDDVAVNDALRMLLTISKSEKKT